MGLGSPFVRVLPFVDGSYATQQDRAHLMGLYRGVLSEAGPDTANERYSMINLALPFGRVFPAPDGAFDSSLDRLHMSYRYRLTPVVPIGPGEKGAITANSRLGLMAIMAQRVEIEALEFEAEPPPTFTFESEAETRATGTSEALTDVDAESEAQATP